MASIRQSPCVVVLNDTIQTKFCRIPAQRARELGGKLRAFEVVFVDEFSDLMSIYVGWNGGESCSSDIYNDCVELPLCLFDGRAGVEALEALQTRRTHDVPMAELNLVEGVKRALGIELTPVIYEDWEAVSANAGVVEDSLLRQMSLVVFGEAFTLRLDNGTAINLLVSRLETEDMYRSLDEEEEKESPTWGKGAFLAFLNQYTSVSVVPLRRPDDMGLSEEELAAQKEAQLEELTQKCISRVYSLFPSRALRCLPLSLRDEDTSYLGCKEGRSRTDEVKANKDKDNREVINPLDACLDLLSTSPSKTPSCTQRGSRGKLRGLPRAFADNDTVCRVHPLFIEQLVEKALRALLSSITASPEGEAGSSLYRTVTSRVLAHFRSRLGLVEVKY